MLIVFNQDGSIEHTRHAALLDLFDGERKRVTRMTDIKFDEQYQRYYIEFLTGHFAGLTLDHQPRRFVDFSSSRRRKELYELWSLFFGYHSPGIFVLMTSEFSPVLMRSYEDAVAMEVAFVDFLRESGYSMR